MHLVVGYGNPLRTDDGLGWQAAVRLAALLPPEAGEVMAAQQLTPEMAEPISRAGLVVFVDAREGDQPGRIDCRTVVPARDTDLTFSHDVDPPSLLALARMLYAACPPAVIVTVDGADFGYGAELSPVVSAALPEVVQWVTQLVTGGPAGIDEAGGIVTKDTEAHHAGRAL